MQKKRIHTDMTLDALNGSPERLRKLLFNGLTSVIATRARAGFAVTSRLAPNYVRVGLRYSSSARLWLHAPKPGSRILTIFNKLGKPAGSTADPQIASVLLAERIGGDPETAIRVVAGIERARKRLLTSLEESTRWI